MVTHRSALPARGPVRLVFDRRFGALFWGRIFAVVGVWTHSLVAAVVVHDATGSALMVGLVGVAQFGPQLVLSPTSGKWADRGNPVHQICLGRALCTFGSGATAVWLAMVSADGYAATTAVLVGSFIVGIGFVVGGPAMQSVVPSLIRDGELSTAMALNSVPMTVGRIGGPAVGALVASHSGAPAAFAVSAALNFVFVILMVFVRYSRPSSSKRATDFRVRAAIRYVRSDRPLLLALVAVATVGFASDPSITLAPSIADALGGGTQLVGKLTASFGVGAAVGLCLLAAQRGKLSAPWTAQWGLLFLALGSAVLTAATITVVALIGFLLAGIGFGVAMAGLGTVVQERAPDELRGRIMALWIVGFVGSRPFAAAVLGGAADVLSVRAAFAISTTVTVAIAFWCRPANLATPRHSSES